ncbi:MAG: AEC family transporter [Bacteroidales bacterium]|nr:AEC family transporter [Bacteroidales bacterium]
MNVLLSQMTILFMVVIAGYICGRTRLMTAPLSKGLSGLIVNLTCPCLVLASTMGEAMPDRRLIIPLLIVGTATYAILLPVSAYLPRLWGCQDPERGLHSFMLTFGNVGFIGYPVVASVFGPEAVFYAAILNVPNTIAVFVWGARFIAGRDVSGSLLSRLVTPAMIGTYLSIIVVATAWRAPHIIAQPITMVGNITVPASLLIIGYSISQIPAKHMAGGPRVWITSFCRLLVMPLLVFGIFQLIGRLIPSAACVFDPSIVRINTLIIAMPVASFGTIFCIKYGVDETVMAQGTFLTTILSLATIPVVAGLI